MKRKNEFFEDFHYEPLPKQKRFHELDKKYRGYIGGLGSGKSHAGVMEALYYAIAYPGSMGVILAPTYRLLEDSTKRAFFTQFDKNLEESYNKVENRLVLINGSEILFRSCEKQAAIDHLRNIEIGWFWVDEASLVPEYAWKVLIGRLRQKEGPLTGWITTTPKGFTWIHNKFVKELHEEYGYVHATSHENIHLPEEYLRSLEQEYTGVFKRQEIYGEFVGFEGLVYQSFSRNIHVIPFIEKKFTEIVAGIDWGFTNPTAVSIIGFDSDRRAYIVDEFYEKRIMTEGLMQVLRDFKRKYNISKFYCDPSEPQFIQKFRNEGFYIIEAKNDVIPGITEVNAHLHVQQDGRPRLYVAQSCVNTIMEFENYRYPDGKEQKPTQENPLKIHDHLMDSVRYVLFTEKANVRPSFSIA